MEDIFGLRIKIYHDYDFGTTTRVFLKGLKYYQLNETKNIILLSCNEPLRYYDEVVSEDEFHGFSDNTREFIVEATKNLKN